MVALALRDQLDRSNEAVEALGTTGLKLYVRRVTLELDRMRTDF